MRATSIIGTSTDEIAIKLKNCISEGYAPKLAFVFITDIKKIQQIMDLLIAENIEVFGAITAGQFTDEKVLDNGISILLLDINPAYYKLVIKDLENVSTVDAAKDIATIGKNTFSNPAFIISGSHLNVPGEFIIDGITEVAGYDVTIIGGMSGEPIFFKGTVFTNGKTFEKGIISLILDQNKIDVNGVAVSGWKPVGIEKTITACNESWVSTIDHQPALDVLKQYMGTELLENETVGSDNIIRLNTTFPMQVKRKNGYSIMCPILLANLENKSILCGGMVKEGDVFRFSMPPYFEVIDTVIESSIRIKKDKMPNADALLIFSCVGRVVNLGPLIKDELEGITNTWQKPMAGFFCVGEFGKTEGADTSDFHGTTCSWVALKEIEE